MALNTTYFQGIGVTCQPAPAAATGIALTLELPAMKSERVEHAKLGGLPVRCNPLAHEEVASRPAASHNTVAAVSSDAALKNSALSGEVIKRGGIYR